MKTLSAVLLLASCCLIGFAQPVLTSANLPSPPDQYIVFLHPDPAVSEGSAGTNITWDFSNIAAPTDSIVFQFRDPSEVNIGNSFPDADEFLDQQSIDFHFFARSDSQLLRVGEHNVVLGQTVPFSTPFREFAWPEHYTDSYTDSVKSTYLYGGKTFRREGTFTAEYDAYGTLATALGFYSNAIRRKTDYVWTDSTGSGPTAVGTPGFIRSFTWYSPNHRTPLFEYRYVQRDTGGGPFLEKLIRVYDPLLLSRSGTLQSEIKVFPNPSDEVIMANFSGKLIEASLIDIAGKELECSIEKESATKITVNVSKLPTGTYFLRLRLIEGVVSKKIVIE